jgi:hypothetical protein
LSPFIAKGAISEDILKYKNGQVAIHPRFNKLITVLCTTVENSEGMLEGATSILFIILFIFIIGIGV